MGRADEGSYALFQVGCRSIYFTPRLLLIPPVRRLTSIVIFNQLSFAQGHISMLELSLQRTSRWGQYTSPNSQGERLANFDITKPGRPRRQPKYEIHECETSLMTRETGKQTTRNADQQRAVGQQTRNNVYE